MAKKPIKKLKKVQKKVQNPILIISSVFPLQLFPDQLIIDREKITLIRKRFFLTKRNFPILYKDLTTVKMTTGPVFASLRFELTGYEKNPPPLTFLRRYQAVKAKRLIEALIILKDKDLDLSKIPDKELIKRSVKMGKKI